MSRIDTLAAAVEARLGPRVKRLASLSGELTYEVSAAQLVGVCRELRDAEELAFEQLIDLSGIDYLDFGRTQWNTTEATSSGFSRGVRREQHEGPTEDRTPLCDHLSPVVGEPELALATAVLLHWRRTADA